MREENARRKLNKKLDTLARDMEGSVGNAKGFHKATRAYGRALIYSALEEMGEDDVQATDRCIMCGTSCMSTYCTKACEEEAIKLGVIPADKLS